MTHKVIGLSYLGAAVLMAFVGGSLAVLFSSQLAFPEQSLLSGAEYNNSVTLHGMIMVLWVALPILFSAMGHLLIPYTIESKKMLSSSLAILSFGIFVLSIILLMAFFMDGSYRSAWTLYPPLTESLGDVGKTYPIEPDDSSTMMGGSIFLIAIGLNLLSHFINAIHFILTSLIKRSKNIKILELPVVVWVINLSSLYLIVLLIPLIAGAIMLLSDRLGGTGFYDPNVGGDPILFQHLFWFFGNPEILVFTGITAAILTDIGCSAPRNLKWQRVLAYIIVFIIAITFVINLFASSNLYIKHGINPSIAIYFTGYLRPFFLVFLLLTGLYIWNLVKRRVSLKIEVLWAYATIVSLITGGILANYVESFTKDIIYHDTYIVVASDHLTLIPITIFGGFAAIYHWFPKIVGKTFSEFWGKVHFWITFIAFNVIFLPMFIPGTVGQPRHISGYTEATFPVMAGEPYAIIRVISFIALWVMFAAQLIWVYNMIWSGWKGKSVDIEDVKPG